MKLIAYPVLVLAALGVILCLGFFLAGVIRINPFPPNKQTILFVGIFVVWFPTVILMNQLTKDFKQKDIWKAALRGCPPWMRVSLWALIGCVIALSFVPALLGHGPANQTFVLFPVAFYSISFCVMYSLIHVDGFDASRRCLNGHKIPPLAKFCEECGAPAAPDSEVVPGHLPGQH